MPDRTTNATALKVPLGKVMIKVAFETKYTEEDNAGMATKQGSGIIYITTVTFGPSDQGSTTNDEMKMRGPTGNE